MHNTCKYCNGINSVSSRIPLVDFDLNLGILGISKLGIYIRNLDHGSFMDMNIDSYGVGSETLKRLAPICFCPMCGRKLNKEGNYDS